jgi:putative membrane protein
MSETEQAKVTGESLAKGILAGLLGGLVATAAKTLVERIYPPHTHGEPEPANAMGQQLGQQLTGEMLSPTAEAVAAGSIHWAFGAVAGAAYGALAEFYPAATARDGASFGLALGSLMQEGALPALGIAAPHEEQDLRERTSEFSSHLVFGVVAENVRRAARKLL